MKSGNLWTPGHQAIYMGSLLFLDSGNMVTGFHFPLKERVQKNISERNHSMHEAETMKASYFQSVILDAF